MLQNVKLEYELQTEKLQRLEKELHEISTAGNKDDKEVRDVQQTCILCVQEETAWYKVVKSVAGMNVNVSLCRQVFSLKRLKSELEAKLQEQEEELDEQAGVIQQLEQVPCE